MSSVLTRSAAASWRAELRACVALGLPLVLTNAIEMALNLTNAAMIGRIAPQALAASTLALALYNTCLMFGIGLAAAVSPLIARERGAKGADAPRAIRDLIQGGLWNSIVVVIPVWLLLWECQAGVRPCRSGSSAGRDGDRLPARDAMVAAARARLPDPALRSRGP